MHVVEISQIILLQDSFLLFLQSFCMGRGAPVVRVLAGNGHYMAPSGTHFCIKLKNCPVIKLERSAKTSRSWSKYIFFTFYTKI